MCPRNQGIKSVCSLCMGNEKWKYAFDNTEFFKVPCAGVTIKQYRVFHDNNPGADGLSPGVWGYRQAVRHSTLTAAFAGPNPANPVSQMFSSFGLCHLRIFHLHGRLLSPHSGMLLRAVTRLVRVEWFMIVHSSRNTVVGFNPWFVSKDIKILHSHCGHKMGVGGGGMGKRKILYSFC